MSYARQIGIIVTLVLLEILRQKQDRPGHFEPARAGRNGPETALNPVYEAYGPAFSVRAIRAALVAAATPGPLSIGATGVLILMWRYNRKQRIQREHASVMAMRGAGPVEEKKAA